MKLIKLLMLFLVGALWTSGAAGQANATLNILTLNSGQVGLGGTVDIQVTVGNTGPVSSIGVNKVRAQISIPIAIASPLATPLQTGLPAGWTITVNNPATGTITVCNGSDVIPVGTQRQIFIKVQGTALGGPSTINGSLVFSSGASCTTPGTLAGDNTADNLATTSIQVIPAPACSLGVSASAGVIVCNGGTTTLTATPTGAAGAVEYSLTGGAPFQASNTFTVPAGTFTVTAREVATPTCTATSSTVTITQPAQLVAAESHTAILCFGGSSTVTISATGGTAPYTGTGTFTQSAGTQSYPVTDANGCTSSVSVTVTQPTQLVAAESHTAILCFGGSSTVTISATGGTAPYTGTGTFTQAAGTQSYPVTDANGCTSSVSVTVTQPAQLVAAESHTAILCFGGSSTVTITATGGTAPYTGTGTFTQSVGTQSYPVTDANGCTSSVSVTVTQPTQLVAAESHTTILCFGGSSTVTISATGGTAPYTGTGTFAQSAGTQSYPVTDANGCTSSVSVTVAQPASAVVASSTAGAPILCFGGSTTVTVTATGGTPPYTGTGIFTAGGGAYSYTVTDANGCTSITSGTVSQPAAIAVTAVVSTPIPVPGGTGTITVTSIGGTGAKTYVITSGTTINTTGAISGVFTGLLAGSYTFTATDVNGCTGTGSVTMNNPVAGNANATLNILTLNSGQVTVGNIVDIQVTVGNTGPSFIGVNKVRAQISVPIAIATPLANALQTGLPAGWIITVNSGGTITICNGSDAIPANTQRQIFIKVQGTAIGGPSTINGSLIFSNGASCTVPGTLAGDNTADNTSTTSIQVLAGACNLSVSASAGTIACNGGTTTLTATPTGAAGAVEYSLTGGAPFQASNTFTVPAGTYTVTAREIAAPGCSATSTAVTITQPAVLAAAESHSAILCFGGSSTVTITSTGGTAPYTGTGTFTQSAGTTSYTVTDAIGCTSSVSVTVSQPTQLVAAETHTAILCFGGTSTVTISATGGTAPYAGTGTFTQSAGTQSYPVTDANGCTSSVSVTVTQPAQLVAAETHTAILCFGGTSTVTISATGGTAPYAGTGTFTQSAGTTSYTVTDANGCTSSVSVTVTQPAQLVAAETHTAILCFGGTSTVTISATGGTAPYTGTGTFTQSAGTTSYTVTDANGCTSSVSVTVSQPTQLVAAETHTAILCFGGTSTVTISATGGAAPYTGTGTFTQSAGTTSYTVTDANGCTSSVSVTVSQPTQLVAAESHTAILCFGGTSTVTISATGGTAPYAGTGTFTQSAGTQSYPVTDANGCTSSVSVTVTQPPAVTASATSTPVTTIGGTDGTATAIATGGTGSYTYLWSPGGQTTATATALTAGTYTVTVTDANGCTATGTTTVGSPECSISATASAGVIACFGGTTTLTVAVTGGTAPFQYSLNGGAFQSGNTFTVGAGNHTVTVKDAANCIVTSNTLTIIQPLQLVAAESHTAILCFGGTSTVTISATGGTAPYTGTGTFTQAAGTQSYPVTDTNGCTSSVSVTVTQPAQLVAAESHTAILCFGGTSTVTISATGGTAPYAGTGTFTQSAGTQSYPVTDANGCTSSVSVTVTQPAQLVAAESHTAILCFGGTSTVTISATGGTAPYAGTGTFTQSAGTQSYPVTDANGCTSSVSVTVTQPAQLVAAETHTAILCFGGTSTVTISATGGTAPYAGTGTFTQSAGTTSYTVTDAIGCTSSVSVTVSQPTQLVAAETHTAILCFGGTSTVTISATGGTAPYAGTGTFTQSAGTQSYPVTDANGCTSSVSVTVTQPAQLVAAETHTAILCFGGTSTVTISATGGTAPYTGTGTFTQSAGTQSYTVTDANGCTSSVTVTITQPTAVAASATSTPVSTIGGTDGTATVTASGGTAPYTYLWSPGGQTTATATGLAAGTYTVTVTDANGCTATATTTVGSPACNITLSFTQTNVLCFGASSGTATVTAANTTGTVSYLWSNGQTTQTATGLAAGTYSVTVTDGSGCTASGSVTITQPASAVVAAESHTAILCFGGTSTVTISATGGTAPYTGTGTFTQSAGTQSYTVTDANGCTSSVSVTVTQPAQLVAAETHTAILCFGGTSTVTISATGGAAPYTGTGTFTQSAGTTSHTVTDANGCTSSVSVTVSQPTQLVAAESHTAILCFGGTSTVTISATGGTAPYAGTGTFTQSAGTQSYPVTDANGCTSSVSVTVTQPPAVTASATSTPVTTIGGTDGTATAIATGGTGSYTYLWSPGGQTTATATALTAGTYTVTVTDANGCTATGTTTVGSPECSISATASAGVIACFGGTTTLTVAVTGGTAPFQYSLNGGAFQSGNTFTVGAGNHTVTVKDAANCIVTSNTLTIIQPLQLVAAESHTAILCFGGTSTVTISATGGTAPYTGTGTFTQAAGTQSYPVTDTNGCTSSVSVTVTQPAQLVAAESHTAILCFGGTSTVTISATGGTAPYAGTGTFTQSAGTQSYPVTDANGCTSSVSVTVTQPAQLVAAESHTAILCFGGTSTVTISATGGTAPYAGTGTFTQSAGTQSYPVTDANGCTSSVSVTVTQPAQLVAAETHTAILCFGGTSTVTISATGGTAPYAGTGTFTQSAGTTSYTVTDANGCTSSVSVTVTQPAQLVAAETHTAILCFGGTSTVTISATGGTAPYTGTGTFTQSAGTQSYTVTDANGCTSSVTVTITQPTAVAASATSTPVSTIGGTDGTATVTASGGTAPYTYLWSPGGQTTATATGLAAGTYTVTVTDANGCTATATTTVGSPACNITLSFTQTNVLCFGASSGTATVTAANTTGTVSYLWSNGQTTQTATGLAAGTYSVTVTDGSGCTASGSVTITQPASAVVAAESHTAILCFGGTSTVTISATGGTAPYTGTGTFTQSAGTQSYTVTDANGCTSSVSVTVTQPAQLVAAETHTAILCFGGTSTVTISATGGAAPYTGTGTFTQSAGTTSHTVTDANGCTSSVSVTVTQPAQLVAAETHTAILCFGGTSTVTISATGGTAPYTGTGTFTQSAGTTSYTVTDANGCTSSVSVTITQPSAVTVSATSTPVTTIGGTDGTATATATGGTGSYTYSWSPGGQAGSTATGLTAGTYTVTVTDANGCIATANTTVGSPACSISATASAGVIACFGGTTTLTVAVTGGATPFQYSLNGGAFQPGNTFTVGAGSYTVTVTDAANCTVTSNTLTVTQPASAVVASSTAGAPILCFGGTTTVTVTATGGTAPYTGTGTFAVSAGAYSYTVTDANGCTSVTSGTVGQPTFVSVTAVVTTPISFPGGTGTITVTSIGGTGAKTYVITSGTTINTTGATSGVFTGLLAGSYTFTATDANGCTGAASVTLNNPVAGNANATLNILTLNSGQVNLGGVVDVQVTVGNTGPSFIGANKVRAQISVPIAIATPLANALQTGLPAGWIITVNSGGTITICNGSDVIPANTQRQIFIKVQGTAVGGPSTINGSLLFSNGASCTVPGTLAGDNTADNTSTTSIQVVVACNLGVTASAGAIACNGGTTTLTATATGATGAVEYSLNGGAFQAGNTFTVPAGTYTVTAREVNTPACTATATAVTVTEPAQLVAASSAGTIACSGGTTTITVTATGGTAPYTGTGAFTVSAGAYSYTVTDANGCTSVTSGTITQPAQLVAASLAGTIACFGGTTTVTVTATGGTAPYTGTGTFTVSAGAYSYTVTDANGCTSVTSGTITQPAQLVAASSAGSIDCFGGTTTVTVTATGGTAPYNGTGAFTVSAGAYSYTVTDANGCTSVTSGTITQPAQLVAASSAGTITCFGGTTTVTVTATGGTAPYNGTGAFTVSAGAYSYTVTDANGCTSVTSGTITQPAQLVAASSAGTITCFGGTTTVTVTATGGTAPYTGTGTFTVSAGAYSYTVTDTNGCTSVTSGTITQPSQLLAASSASTIACFGGTTTVTVTASGGTAPYTGTGTFTRSAGTYTFTVTDANGCTAVTTITITQPTVLTATATSTPATSGSDGTATVTATGGTLPYTYLWSPGGQTTATATGLAAGIYTVTVTDANGCTATATTTVTTGCGVIANAGPDKTLCPGGTVTLTGSATGGTTSGGVPPPSPFTEVSGSTADKRIFSGNIDHITIGNTFSQHEARDNCNKNSTSSKTLILPAGAVVKKAYLYWSGSGSVDNTVKLNGTTVTAENTKTDYISGVGSFFGARKDVTSLVTASGNYIVSDLTWSNASSYCNWNGAYGAWGMAVVYELSSLPSSRIHVNTENFNMTYGAGTYSTTINNISVPVGCTPDAKLTIIAFEGDNYKGERLRINNVLDADTNNFRGQAGPNLDIITKNAPSIVGGTTSLTYSIESYQTNTIYGPAVEALFDYVKVLKYKNCPAGGCNGYTYQWTKNGVAVGTAQNISVSAPGTYVLRATDCANCSATDEVVVTASTLAASSTVVAPVNCYGGTTTVTVSATGGTAPYTGTGTFTKGAGTWNFTVTDATGCTAVTTVTISQPTQLAVTATAPAIPCGGTSTTVTVSATGGTAPYTGTGTFTKGPGSWTFTVTDVKGCTASATVVIANAIACGPVDPNKCYKLIARHSGKVATVANSSTANGGNVEQRSYSGGNNQIWKFEQVETGYYKVINVNSAKVLDVAGASTANGANVHQWTYGGGNNQKWSLTASGSYFVVKAKHSGKTMSVAGSSNSNGANVEQRGTGSNQNEQWTIAEAGCPGYTTKIAAPVVPEEEAIEAELMVTVHPNPSISYFNLTIKSNDNTAPVNVRILDAYGKVISVHPKVGVNSTLRIGSDKWAGGIYFAEVTQGGERKVVKMVKAN